MSISETLIRHQIETSPDGTNTRFSYFIPEEGLLRTLFDDLFLQHWKEITVGPCIEGAVFEVRFAEQPKLSFLDGYLTVDLGTWHFHLCTGTHKGSPSEELRRNRPVFKIALFERRGKGCGGGRSWGLRMWNGYGEQMMTVWLPSATLTEDMKMLREPDWSRLTLYYSLRSRLLGEPTVTDYAAEANREWEEAQ